MKVRARQCILNKLIQFTVIYISMGGCFGSQSNFIAVRSHRSVEGFINIIADNVDLRVARRRITVLHVEVDWNMGHFDKTVG